MYFESQDEKHFKLIKKELLNSEVLFFLVKKSNAVNNLNKLVGNTNPKFAEKNTLRKKYGISILKNSIHASNLNRVLKEIYCIFPENIYEMVKNKKN